MFAPRLFATSLFASLVTCGALVACAHQDQQENQLLIQQLQAKCAQRGQTFVVDDAPQGNMVVSGRCVGAEGGAAPASSSAPAEGKDAS